jgi:hypothetical protein
MTNWAKSAKFGGIYASSIHTEYRQNSDIRQKIDFEKFSEYLERIREYTQKYWGKIKHYSPAIKHNLRSHISEKQEVYWPVLIAIVLLLFVFVSRIASAETISSPNNLPIEDNSKMKLIGFEVGHIQNMTLANAKSDSKEAAENEQNIDFENLKKDIAEIVENTPMAAMIDSISENNRTVAAFIVGIAMKESKFGIYAPHVAGRDCYNYWGLKAGGKTTAGGYTCFSSPDEAVNTVSKNIEKMVAKGVHTPAQAISWKCGSSCAGHDPAGVRKWIADVGVNFYKINS